MMEFLKLALEEVSMSHDTSLICWQLRTEVTQRHMVDTEGQPDRIRQQ